MRGNWINCTHNGTGGTSTITVVDQAGWPGFNNVFIGNRFVDYEILEYTNSSKSTLLQAEAGIGSINTSTNVLTRTKITATWTGGIYLPNLGSATVPSAINFGNTAANISIVCSPSAATHAGAIPFTPTPIASVSDGLGAAGANFLCQGSSITQTSGMTQYALTKFDHHGPFRYATVRVGGTAATTGSPTPPSLTVGIYEIASNGFPGKLLATFNCGSPTVAYTNLQSSALAIPVEMVPGWYYVATLYLVNNGSGTPNISVANYAIGSYSSLSGSVYASSFASGQTTLTDPATPPTFNLSNPPIVWFL